MTVHPTPPAIELRGITKRFGGVVANDQINLSVLAGEIHALVGENGAGKSTLVKVLGGLYRPDAGEVLVAGRSVRLDGPGRAIALGIGMVHQHFMLIPRFTVTENVILGAEGIAPRATARRRLGVIDMAAAEARVAELCERAGFALDPRARVADLSVGQQQRVEILKVLYRGADVLVLDEPTAVLAPREVEDLFANLRRLREQGKTILFIAHKLDEVLALADRITVLRRGRSLGTVPAAATTREELAALMVGRSVALRRERAAAGRDSGDPGAPSLELRNLSVRAADGRPAVHGLSFRVHAGEIYGLAGVEGNGQAELVDAVLGLRPAAGGSVRISGQDVTAWPPGRRRGLGVAYIPADRHRQGLVLPMAVWENLLLGRHRSPALRRGPLFRLPAIREHAWAAAREYDIRLASPLQPASGLSGGNQQKVILARELGGRPRVIVAAQPTRGLDVGATEFVEERLLRARREGCAILLVSSDLDQLVALSDRIGVLYAGRLVAEFDGARVDPEEVGRYMLGAAAPPAEGGARAFAGGGRDGAP